MKRIFIIAFFIMLLFVVGCTSSVVVTFDTQGGTEISSVTIKKGSRVEEPTPPVRGEDEFVGWFVNDVQWDFDDPIFEDITLVSKYLKQDEYKVVFYDYDGNVLKTELVQKGESATAPTAPEVEGYTFVGWSKDFTNVTSNLEVYPLYDDGKVEFVVSFMDWNGKILKEERLEAGQNATPPADPEREGYL